MSTIIALVILVALVGFVVAIYNGLVTSRNASKNGFSQIDVQLQRRHDLIPNLVQTAKGALAHERGTLEAVIAARNGATAALAAAKANPGDPAAMQKLGGAEGLLASALGNLKVTIEAYPDLKANATMMQLNEELASTENRVAFARQAYNDAVMSYNNRREVFPNNLIAGPFGFAPQGFLEIEAPAMRETPKVQF